MNLDITRVRNLLHEFDFKSIFIEELGWNHCSSQREVFEIRDGQTLSEKQVEAVPISNGVKAAFFLKIRRKENIIEGENSGFRRES